MTRQLARRHLHLKPDPQVNLHTFTLCNPHVSTKEDLLASAVLIYAVYRATNHYRFHRTQERDTYNALRQWTREAVLGHGAAMRTLDNLWNPARAHQPLPPIPASLPPNTRQATKRPRQTASPQDIASNPTSRARQTRTPSGDSALNRNMEYTWWRA